VPGEATGALPGENSKSQNDRKEELSNYELNSKVVSTVSNGYKVENMTVAVVVNRKAMMASLGANATPEVMDRQLKELQAVVENAAGIDAKRGDRVTVTALDFTDAAAFPPLPEPGIVDVLMRQAGSFINAAALIIATFLLVWFGLRPAVQGILDQAPPQIAAEPAPLALEAGTAAGSQVLEGLARPEQPQLPEITIGPSPQQKLENIINFYEEQAAALLKQWMKTSK
jgi:flagellar M-ring protein FliF